MDNPPSPALSPTAAAALEAHQAAKTARQQQNVPKQAADITSLNTFLQWSTANTDQASQAEQAEQLPPKTEEQLAKDREWLDAAFPDIYADVKHLISLLTTETTPPLTTDETVTALESLEELFADLNHAINIDKLGALDPLLEHASAPSAEVRAAAVWALGTALQDLPEVKAVFLSRDGHQVLARALRDDHAAVRSKAVRAASALLRQSSDDVRRLVSDSGVSVALRAALADTDVRTRRRARFFLQHARETENDDFVQKLLVDRGAVARLCDSVKDVDVDDVADIEATVGAVKVILEVDRQGVLQVAPELPGVIDELIAQCSDADCREALDALVELLS